MSRKICYNSLRMELKYTSPENPSRMIKTLRKYRIGEEPSDFQYWQTQPPSARLAALEMIRHEYIAWKYDTEPRLQRVYTIVKQQ